mgnify:CR=1 FL=1
MDAQSTDCRFDLRTHPLEIYVAGPLRTGLEIDIQQFGDHYDAFRTRALNRVKDALDAETSLKILLPDTAHGEPDDEATWGMSNGPEWSGFGSKPYRPTAFLELDREVKNLAIETGALLACARQLGCAGEAACGRFAEMTVRARRFSARLHDAGFAVLTVQIGISGPDDLSAEELRLVCDCAVEAAKSEVEERFERVRPSVVEATFAALRDWREERAGKKGPNTGWHVRDRRKAPPGDRDAARAEGLGYLIAFHRLIELAYGDGLRDRREAESAAERLVEKSHESGLEYCRPHPDYAAYLGYLNSVFIFPQERRDEDRTARLNPLPVIQFYEFAFAAMQDLDRRLFLEIETTRSVLQDLRTRSRTARERRYIEAQDKIAGLREEARLLEFRIDSDIDTLPPAHLTYWYQILASWRVPQLRRGIDEKVAFLEQHYGHMHQRMEADLTRRTNTIILFLTAITALSVLADTLGFAFDRQFPWGPNARNILSLLAGSLLFGFAAWLYWTRTHRSELARLERDGDDPGKSSGSQS